MHILIIVMTAGLVSLAMPAQALDSTMAPSMMAKPPAASKSVDAGNVESQPAAQMSPTAPRVGLGTVISVARDDDGIRSATGGAKALPPAARGFQQMN